MVKKAKESGFTFDPGRESDRLVTLLRTVPTEVFVAMVNRAGLPTKESRKLCAAFKALKG